MELHIITFSPTKTSRKVANGIAIGIGERNIHWTDITYQCQKEQNFNEGQLVIVSVPVYGGHIAPLAKQRLNNMQGNNTPAVAVVVYGNRHYEHALDELAMLLSEKGFRIIAAGTFIGEHSYSTEQTPIAVGRPDAKDMLDAEHFGRRIVKKLQGDCRNDEVNVQTIEQPEQDDQTMINFKQTVMTWMNSGIQMPVSPEVDASLCNECGICVSLCPTSAINEKSLKTSNPDKCIKCCACVKGCPNQARKLHTPFAQLLSNNFNQRKENKFLI